MIFMCFDCMCAHRDYCSILQQQPFGFCCFKCAYYDESIQCAKLEQKVKKVLKKEISESN